MDEHHGSGPQHLHPDKTSRPELAALAVTVLADGGAVHLCNPEPLAIQLSPAELERQKVFMSDGNRHAVPCAGSVEVRFKVRRCCMRHRIGQ